MLGAGNLFHVCLWKIFICLDHAANKRTRVREKEGKAYKETDWSTADLLFSLTEALLGRD